MVGNADEVLDAALGLARADQQVADHVDRAPILGLNLENPLVFGNGLVEPTLAQEFLGPLQCRITVDCHCALT